MARLDPYQFKYWIAESGYVARTLIGSNKIYIKSGVPNSHYHHYHDLTEKSMDTSLFWTCVYTPEKSPVLEEVDW